MCRWKKTSKLSVTGFFAGKTPVTDEFPVQMTPPPPPPTHTHKEIGFLCGLKFFALNIVCGEYLQLGERQEAQISKFNAPPPLHTQFVMQIFSAFIWAWL